MADLTLRCTCGAYYRATDVPSLHLLDLARTFFTRHICKEMPK